MSDEHYRQMDLLLRNALRSLDGRLPNADAEIAQEYVDHNEFGIALEHICTQLSEFEIAVPLTAIDLLRTASEAMRLPSGTWSGLTVESV